MRNVYARLHINKPPNAIVLLRAFPCVRASACECMRLCVRVCMRARARIHYPRHPTATRYYRVCVSLNCLQFREPAAAENIITILPRLAVERSAASHACMPVFASV